MRCCQRGRQLSKGPELYSTGGEMSEERWHNDEFDLRNRVAGRSTAKRPACDRQGLAGVSRPDASTGKHQTSIRQAWMDLLRLILNSISTSAPRNPPPHSSGSSASDWCIEELLQ